MDQKYLAEIKARAEGAAVHEYDGITDLIYGRDVKALLSDNAAKDQQIATLKKALEIMQHDLPNPWTPIERYVRQAQEQEAES